MIQLNHLLLVYYLLINVILNNGRVITMECDKVEYEYFDNGNIKNEYWYNEYGRLNRTVVQQLLNTINHTI